MFLAADGAPSKSIKIDRGVAERLVDLKFSFGKLNSNLERLIKSHLTRNPFLQRQRINKFITMLQSVFQINVQAADMHSGYEALAAENDMFNVFSFRSFVQHFFYRHPSLRQTGEDYIHQHKIMRDDFLCSVTLKQLENAILEAVPRSSEFECLTLILDEEIWSNCTQLALKQLVYKVFGVHKNVLLDMVVKRGSIVVEWKFRKDLRPAIVDLVKMKLHALKENNVIGLLVGEEILFDREVSR